jgi:UDP-N-acetylglucosamine 2-epimerase (non-hydrolysing)
MKSIAVIIGTRPEAIKLAPVIVALRQSGKFRVIVIASGQHRELVPTTLRHFNIEIDHHCDVMTTNQTLAGVTARLFTELDAILNNSDIDIIMAQGDTTTVLVASMLSFYLKKPFCHVEAGLRSGDISTPFPEELNRRITSIATSLHFAPTEQAKKNLQDEGVSHEQIVVTGNTVIDALLYTTMQKIEVPNIPGVDKKFVLLTAHRRENFGVPHAEVFGAIKELVERFPELHFIYPVHPNPNVKDSAIRHLAGIDRVALIQPVDYPIMCKLLEKCYFVMTDSGGIQEEAPALNKPVVILRNETERPEIVSSGAGILVGTDRDTIIGVVEKFMTDPSYFNKFCIGHSPVGDGKAAKRIVEKISNHFSAQIITK